MLELSANYYATLESIEYQLIREFYAEREAARSKVPLMNHINEGLIVLDMIGAHDCSMKAFCLHPMVQDDQPLKKHYIHIQNVCSSLVIMMAMEYRNVANIGLLGGVQQLSPLSEVNDMLIADKVQNRKDLELYHMDSHPRADILLDYFKNWLNVLSVSEDTYQQYKTILMEKQ